MNVKTLMNLLSKEVKKVDRENAEIEFWIGEQQYDIEEISGFSLSPDICVDLIPVETPIVQPARFKKEHAKMVKEKFEEITDEINKEKKLEKKTKEV